MQWIAIVSMLIDHIGIVWFPDSPLWRIVGRLAFPIYTYYVAVGMTRTRSRRAYVIRLALLAVISQLPFSLLFQTQGINVIGTFLVSVLVACAWEASANRPLLKTAVAGGAAVLLEALSFDYGAYGLFLLLLYRYFSGHALWIGHLGLNVVYMLIFSLPLQLFSIFPSFYFAYASASASGAKGATYTVPRWLWRSFYPAHLALLFILSRAIG